MENYRCNFGAGSNFSGGIAERTAGRLPRLDEVRESVQRDWYNARRIEAGESLFTELLKKYTVTVDWPEESSEMIIGDAR